MSSFTLPPPPPPPPKATSQQDSSHHQSSSARGNRGSFRGRGRGSNARGSARGGGGRGDFSQHHGKNHHPSAGSSSNVTSSFASLPQNFTSVQAQNVQGFPSPVSSPQSGSGSAGTKRKLGSHEPQRMRAQDAFQVKPTPVNKPKVEVAPAVPSFGFSLPLPPAAPTFRNVPTELQTQTSVSNPKAEKQKPKRKSNQLGLTPQGYELDHSEEEDLDEEAAYVSYSGPLRVEYNGVITELSSADALKQWIEERRRKWPTRARVEEKKKQALKEKQDALRRKLEADVARKKNLEARNTAEDEQKKKDREQERVAKARKALEKHLAKANKLRKKLGIEASESGAIPSTSPILDRSVAEDTVADATNTVLSTASLKASDQFKTAASERVGPLSEVQSTSSKEESSDPDLDSDSDSFSSDSDSASSTNAPEERSSKSNGPVRVSPPKRGKSHRVCQEFASRGRCGRGDRCSFKHDTSSRNMRPKLDRQKQPQSMKRKTLHERLVEQEQETENRLALQAVKYLGQKGLLDDF